MPSVPLQPPARHPLFQGPAKRQGRGGGPPSGGGPPPWTGTSRGEVRLRNVLADDWRPDMAPAAGRPPGSSTAGPRRGAGGPNLSAGSPRGAVSGGGRRPGLDRRGQHRHLPPPARRRGARPPVRLRVLRLRRPELSVLRAEYPRAGDVTAVVSLWGQLVLARLGAPGPACRAVRPVPPGADHEAAWGLRSRRGQPRSGRPTHRSALRRPGRSRTLRDNRRRRPSSRLPSRPGRTALVVGVVEQPGVDGPAGSSVLPPPLATACRCCAGGGVGSLVVGSVRSDISLSSLSSPTGRARDVCRQGQTEWSGAAWVSAPRGKRMRPAAPAPARFATPGGRLEAGATRPRAAARPRWPSSHRDLTVLASLWRLGDRTCWTTCS
jgi:hypothetical protein